MKKSLKQLLAEANEVVVTYTPAEAMAYLDDESVVFVDIRDAPELARNGKIPDAVHAPAASWNFWLTRTVLITTRSLPRIKNFCFIALAVSVQCWWRKRPGRWG